MRDVAARIAELEARLRAAERERDAVLAREAALGLMADTGRRAQAEFLGKMSHALRTPLNAILGYVELLRLQIHGPVSEEQARALGHVVRNAHQLLGLVSDLLNVARLARAEIEPHLQVKPVIELCGAIDPIGELRAVGKGLTYRRVDCDPSISVRADPALAEQVLRNLVSNAIKFTAAPGMVTRLCQAGHSVVRMGVEDTGRGIAPERLQTIFDPFVQVDPEAFPERRRGVGLGLAIARDLAQLMGGDIEVESTLGTGSTFTLVLPRAP